jgi:glycerol uptake facilitator-like aquaporin
MTALAAVTLAVWVSRRNKIGGLDAIIYVVVQVAAAFLAALFCWGVTDKTVAVQPGV